MSITHSIKVHEQCGEWFLKERRNCVKMNLNSNTFRAQCLHKNFIEPESFPELYFKTVASNKTDFTPCCCSDEVVEDNKRNDS